MTRSPLDATLEPPAHSLGLRALRGVAEFTAAVLAVATTVLAAQPIYANDTWIHLALGRAFLAAGPWLTRDPYLFTAPGPPEPSSWLGSIAIYTLYSTAGFAGVRLVHGLLVLSILVLVWRCMRITGSDRMTASAGVVCFIAVATYRLVQLRPELFTIVATLSLHPLFIANPGGPDTRRILGAAALGALWANVHAAFLLGPLLLLGAGGATFASALLRRERGTLARAFRRGAPIAAAGFAMAIGALVNPLGFRAFLAYSRSGRRTPGLETISDEWNPTNLFAWPVPALPPTIASWLLTWLCLIGVAWVVVGFVRASVRGDRSSESVDPALLALAIAGVVAAAQASRFLWLDVFALMLIGQAWCGAQHTVVSSIRPAFVMAFVVCATALHLRVGDWPLVSRALLAAGADYRAPYPSERFNSTPVWFLADSGVTGRLFNDYPLGGFLSFWLSPDLQMASSGTMNVEKEAMEANLAIARRQPMHAGEDFEALLDRMGIDLFLGLGFPIEATPGRPIPCTVRHLEHAAGWIPVFRNLRTAVYLRRNARNDLNLARIEAYYERAGVPFDRTSGFDAGKALLESPRWAEAHGLAPAGFESLVRDVAMNLRGGRVDIRTHQLATIHAVLGRYEQSLDLDREILQIDPGNADAAWRVLWSLIQADRIDDAIRFGRFFENPLRGSGPSDAWSSLPAQLKEMDADGRASVAAHLPLLRAEHLAWVRNGVAFLPPRLVRPVAPP